MQVHLVDGTYELFRYHYARSNRSLATGATRGVLASMLDLVESGATHIGVATDHVIESFRNDLWPGYKDGSGIDADLAAQFPLVEHVLRAAGFVVWAMVKVEADDALAAAAAVADADPAVDRVIIATPDKDLAQCVRGNRIVQLDRRSGEIRDEAGVVARFGVPPSSICDYLALVGDTADGFPGLPGWGAKSTAAVLARYGRIEDIPTDPADWDVTVRSSTKLAAALVDGYAEALLFRRLATLERDVEVGAVADWRWTGPTPELAEVCERLDAPGLARRAGALAAGR